MSRFSEDVDRAAQPYPKVWRLMVFAVPASLGGLLVRHGFRAAKKNPANWWRTFDPAADKALAETVRADLLAAGLKGKWSEVEQRNFIPKTARSGFAAHPVSREGFGGKLNARPIAGSWRRRKPR